MHTSNGTECPVFYSHKERARCPTEISETADRQTVGYCFNLHPGLKENTESLDSFMQAAAAVRPEPIDKEPIMYKNEMSSPAFSMNNQITQPRRHFDDVRDYDDTAKIDLEERQRSHITVVPFSRTQTGSFQ